MRGSIKRLRFLAGTVHMRKADGQARPLDQLVTGSNGSIAFFANSSGFPCCHTPGSATESVPHVR